MYPPSQAAFGADDLAIDSALASGAPVATLVSLWSQVFTIVQSLTSNLNALQGASGALGGLDANAIAQLFTTLVSVSILSACTTCRRLKYPSISLSPPNCNQPSLVFLLALLALSKASSLKSRMSPLPLSSSSSSSFPLSSNQLISSIQIIAVVIPGIGPILSPLLGTVINTLGSLAGILGAPLSLVLSLVTLLLSLL